MAVLDEQLLTASNLNELQNHTPIKKNNNNKLDHYLMKYSKRFV